MRFSCLTSKFLTLGLVLTSTATLTLAFDNTRSDNLAVYWGQNSYGAGHPSDTANYQKTLSAYCQDSTINVFPMAFLDVFFSTGGLPEINMANICSSEGGVFSGTNLANCQFLAADIEACQAMGKIVTISLGGATGAAGFTSNAQAQSFADTIWNLFLGGSSSTRPFGNAVLDGVDLDIEGGSGTGFAAFVTQIRSHASGASKKYYVTGAPQCPFPDAYLGSVINAVGFDALYVQVLYNNYCGLTGFSNANDWDFSTWDNWAKNTSPNKAVKIYIGAPASSTAAGSGYVDAATLGNIAVQTRAQYSSFGGIMLWDASQAYANGRYDIAIKNALGGSTSPVTTAPTTTKPPTTTSPKPSSTASTGNCASVAAWSSASVYTGGQQAVYGGHLWTAKWWTEADTPGGAAGVWTDDGACTSSNHAATVHAAQATRSTISKSKASNSPNTSSTEDTTHHKASRFFKVE